jgi:hypothetical protein
MTTDRMPQARRKGSQTIVGIYNYFRQRIFSTTLQQFRCNPTPTVTYNCVLNCISTLRIDIETKYFPGDRTYDHVMAILSLYQVPILA